MKPLYIFDLDGTLALIDHRRGLLDGDSPNWKAFHDACVDDLPNVPVITSLRSLKASGADVWIFSGRCASVRDQSVQWLKDHLLVDFDYDKHLIMRDEGDNMPDDDLKQSWYDGMLDIDKANLVAVFDDRDRVVNMWRRNGVACFQVQRGDF